jgi:hypothetical protein
MEQKRFRKFCLYYIRDLEDKIKAISNINTNQILYFNQQNTILQNKDFSTIQQKPLKPMELTINLSESNLATMYIKKSKQNQSFLNLKTQNILDYQKTKNLVYMESFKKLTITQTLIDDNESTNRISGNDTICVY